MSTGGIGWLRGLISWPGIPIVVAGMIGSLMVIGVNGWMNDPGGFEIDESSNVVNVNPFAAFVNSNVWHETVHMYLAGFIVSGFIVAGVYAFGWLRGRRELYHKAAMVVPLTFACLAAPAQVVVGDWAARTAAETQPTKLAAFEGLQETTEGADLSVGGIMIGDTLRPRRPRPGLPLAGTGGGARGRGALDRGVVRRTVAGP